MSHIVDCIIATRFATQRDSVLRDLQFNETACYEVNYEACNSTGQRVTRSTTKLAIQRDSVLRDQLRSLQFNGTAYILRGLQFNGTACYEINVTTLSNFEQSLIQLLNLYDKLYDNQAVDLEILSRFSSYLRIFRLNTE